MHMCRSVYTRSFRRFHFLESLIIKSLELHENTLVIYYFSVDPVEIRGCGSIKPTSIIINLTIMLQVNTDHIACQCHMREIGDG
jgi:hypothetical protein